MTTIISTRAAYMLHLPKFGGSPEQWINMAQVRRVVPILLDGAVREVQLVYADGKSQRFFGTQAVTIIHEAKMLEERK